MISSRKISIGILAHVDAGKTTLSEAMLYLSGSIRKAGRVDHKDTFLDTYSLERERGITIFSKLAKLNIGDFDITLHDTPGHTDFSPETERTLQVLDYAILVINGSDGVTGQTVFLWKLLDHYNIPVFIFVNKMDRPDTDRTYLMNSLKEKLSDSCVDFSGDTDPSLLKEAIAVCDEGLLNKYLEKGDIEKKDIIKLILKRRLFPCCFGSALKMEGVREFMDTLALYISEKEYPEEFGARIYKISRDEQGNRLTWMKLTGGSLSSRDRISYVSDNARIEEKADQLRIYSGNKFNTVNMALAGDVLAVTGLKKTRAGEGLGNESSFSSKLIQPFINRSLILPEGEDSVKLYTKLKLLEEEEPMLNISFNEKIGEINIRVMGNMQTEIIKHLIRERFDIDVAFGKESIVYKETVKSTVEGVGHFEPLRHYAEVHLLLEPGEPGSGISITSVCPPDMLDRNWQRLIITHIGEKKHTGVLTGSELTDIKITLTGGRAHEKHTEGGDFRQATYRAIRQGLMMAENLLLEPVYKYEIELPISASGRAMNDIKRMSGTIDEQKNSGNICILTGIVPASEIGDYKEELSSYTSGQGILSLELSGYAPCHNSKQVIEETGYDPDSDTLNPSSSVFCSHGSGTVIPWDKVRDYMHVDTGISEASYSDAMTDLSGSDITGYRIGELKNKDNDLSKKAVDYIAEENELKSIFEKTYGPVKKREYNNDPVKYVAKPQKERTYKGKETPLADEYLLIDGYNIIYASKELHELAVKDIKAARDILMDILVDFQGFRRETVILVFDAYLVPGGSERVLRYQNIDVVFTKEAETADQYIERTAHEIRKKHRVTVATSDRVEQVIIMGSGSNRMSATDFWNEIARTREAVSDHIKNNGLRDKKLHNTLENKLPNNIIRPE
ncbi:MAG: TetM/TetW/TetO/TetS family tetracycline resistance ribosomal protection protein [Lachnospiraceae bacterium]|nr:TetM/TetW/TetO/TetS family tetracycline resistance ribosomal protection protein [Lachnospiraceae bacterium]